MLPDAATALRACLTLMIVSGLLSACEGKAPSASASLEPDGRWLVVNYWADWCKPCLEEIPELNAFAEANAADVRVVLVNFDGITGDPLADQIARLGIETDHIDPDPAEALGIQRPSALPSTFVFNPGRQLTQTLLGPQTVESLTRATIGRPIHNEAAE